MAITTSEVKELRERTGCGMMDCKVALAETDGDMERAIEILRTKGLAAAAKRADRVASQGIIESYIHFGGKIGVLVELNCETDFVARNEDFIGFAKSLAMQIAAASPLYISREEIPQETLLHERSLFVEQSKQEGKPEKAIEKIVDGRMEKYYSEVCLLDQPFIREQKTLIKTLLTDLVAKIGEKIVIRRFIRYQLGEKS